MPVAYDSKVQKKKKKKNFVSASCHVQTWECQAQIPVYLIRIFGSLKIKVKTALTIDLIPSFCFGD